MNKTIFCLIILSLFTIVIPESLLAQKKDVFKSKFGTNMSLLRYDHNSSAILPAMQLSFDNLMIYSIGPLFKFDSNYQTVGLDIKARLRLSQCKKDIEPIMDYGLQYYKSKPSSDSIQINIFPTAGLGFYAELKSVSISATLNCGLSTVNKNKNIWFLKVTVGFPNLYRYKSLIQPKTKSKRRSST